MYVDDSGAIKELPINRRASEFAACCGAHVQVHGDAFVARFRDNEDEFERLDFQLNELSSSAPWVEVRSVMRIVLCAILEQTWVPPCTGSAGAGSTPSAARHARAAGQTGRRWEAGGCSQFASRGSFPGRCCQTRGQCCVCQARVSKGADRRL